MRFIGNRSSGKQGYAVARVAAQRGAEVTLIVGHTAGLAEPAGVHVLHISSAAQLHEAVSKHAPDAHVLVMAAAVADFRPANVATAKIKKTNDTADTPTVDWCAPTTCWPARCGSAPTASCRTCARSWDSPPRPATPTATCCSTPAKLRRKACDLLVVNAVGDGLAFEVDSNDGWLLGSDGTEVALEHGSKTLMASRIVDAIATFLRGSDG